MKQTNNVLRWVARRMDLPSDALTGDPVLELKGNREAVVICHRGIVGYQEACVTVATSLGEVVIAGSGLQIERMNAERIVIYGKIDSVRLEGA